MTMHGLWQARARKDFLPRNMAKLVLLVVCALSLGGRLMAQQFETRSISPAVAGPWGALVADFNHDGKLDLVVTTCIVADQVSIMLGNGDGTFRPPVNYSVEGCPGTPVTGDFNHDGNLDVVVPVYKYGKVSGVDVLLGRGDGTFQPPAYYPAPQVAYQALPGDFNNDHSLDLVVLIPNALCVLLGNGDGTFQPCIVSPLPAEDNAIAVGDFNNDGKLDVAANLEFGSESSAQIMLGNGDGTFTYSASYPVPDPVSIVAARLTGSKNDDLVIANGGANTANGVSVLLGNGDGTFQPAVNYAASNPIYAAVADLNGDGIPDIVAVEFLMPAGASVFLGNGDGTFQPGVFYPAGDQSRFVGIGDFNGDHKVDLAIPSYGVGNVPVLLNTGVVNFSPTTPLNFKKQAVGTTSNPQTVTLTNTGKTALRIASMKASAEFSVTSTCGASVAAGAKCTISATFSPTKKGSVQGTITIIDSASTKPQIIELFGTGT